MRRPKPLRDSEGNIFTRELIGRAADIKMNENQEVSELIPNNVTLNDLKEARDRLVKKYIELYGNDIPEGKMLVIDVPKISDSHYKLILYIKNKPQPAGNIQFNNGSTIKSTPSNPENNVRGSSSTKNIYLNDKGDKK